LVVIGVHAPEFSFEHELDLVRQATQERGIDYPVALYNDYAIWSAFANHYWPALYFVDADGIIRDQHFGEGRSGRAACTSSCASTTRSAPDAADHLPRARRRGVRVHVRVDRMGIASIRFATRARTDRVVA
jgi:hypothetical protein